MRREGRLAGVTGRTCAAVVVAAVVTAGCGRVPDGPAPARSTSAAAPGKDGNLAPAPEATPLPAGHLLTEQDIAIKSPGDGLPPYELERIVGRTLRRAVRADESLTFGILEPERAGAVAHAQA